MLSTCAASRVRRAPGGDPPSLKQPHLQSIHAHTSSTLSRTGAAPSWSLSTSPPATPRSTSRPSRCWASSSRRPRAPMPCSSAGPASSSASTRPGGGGSGEHRAPRLEGKDPTPTGWGEEIREIHLKVCLTSLHCIICHPVTCCRCCKRINRVGPHTHTQHALQALFPDTLIT